jgi:hypothetical protein
MNPTGFIRIAAVAALGAALAGCAGGSDIGAVSGANAAVSGVSGDERGGRIPNGMNDVPGSMTAARSHCARFNKKAQITQMQTAAEGGLVAFECR